MTMRLWALCMLAACGDSGATMVPAWDRELPPSSTMGGWQGLVPARGIIHLHSPFSHDACDGKPRDASGTVNEPCLQSLRAALCATRIDYAALTDHDASMADEEYASLFHMRGGDEAVYNANNDQIASRIHCDNGHAVLLTVGGENPVMPIMLDRHVAGTVQQRRDIYNGASASDIAAMRAAGAKIWFPHTESSTREELLAIDPDGIEVYNLHANIDPNIRPMHLGLDAFGAIQAAVEFADTNEGGPEPDLTLLSFLAPNEPSLARWDELLAAGRKVAGSAGSDAHENALPVMLADGERGDSYRRVMRWFGNIALVADATDIEQIEAALGAGRMYNVFELLGTPTGFSIEAGGYHLGDTVPRGTLLHVQMPRIAGLDTSLPAPAMTARVIHVPPGGSPVVAATTSTADVLELTLDEPGAYRVEVAMTPRHLAPYLRDLGPALANQELPWIYASPLYVE